MAALVNPSAISDKTIDGWIETKPGGAGYDASRKCYCWGYRPKYTPPAAAMLIGLRGVKWADMGWSICPDSSGKCACAAPVKCPVCKTPTTAPKCPVCATPVQPPPGAALEPSEPVTASEPAPTFGSKWGVTVGWLLGLAAVGGGGYFMFKKGAFKK